MGMEGTEALAVIDRLYHIVVKPVIPTAILMDMPADEQRVILNFIKACEEKHAAVTANMTAELRALLNELNA